MDRKLGGLPRRARVTDHISLGAIAAAIPMHCIHEVLRETKRASVRQRLLPAHLMVLFAVALALHMHASGREVLRCLLDGLQWLAEPAGRLRVAGDAAISQARTRLGFEPLKRLHERLVGPLAGPGEPGSWYRQWRMVSIDGSTLDVPDEPRNEAQFGRPQASRGRSAFPKIRFVSLVEGGTHVLFGTRMGSYTESELSLARTVIESLKKGMLCMADRNFFGFKLWNQALATGADLLWRVKKNLRLRCEKRLEDGSFLSTIYPSRRARRRGRGGVCVRVVEYRLEGVEGAEPLYRLVTSVLEPERAPAAELAALYHERWEIETAFDELKTHLRGARVVLRSKTPDLVRQEFHGLLLAHYAIRKLMHEAAVKAGLDPDCLSFLHAVRVVRRRLPLFVMTAPSQRAALRESVLEEILEERVDSSRGRRNPRAVKRKMSSYPLKRSQPRLPSIPDIAEHIRIVK